MIDEFDLAKALRDQADIVAAANSYTLVGNGEGFEPDVNALYIEEIVLYGNNESIGLANNSSDIEIGIYQLSVHSPKTQPKWVGLQVVGVLKAHFVRGLKPSFNGQQAIIETSSLAPMMHNDTHLIHHLSITFSVIN